MFMCVVGRSGDQYHSWFLSIYRETVDNIQSKIGKKIFETVLRYTFSSNVL